MADSLSQDFRSFIALALALKPAVTMHSGAEVPGMNMKLKVSVAEQLHEQEMASLEPLMAKYKPLKPYLDGVLRSEISIAKGSHTVNFSPNVRYRLIQVTEQQFNLAKDVTARLERIHAAYGHGDLNSAKSEYDSFHKFLKTQRDNFVGEFKGLEFSNAVADYGVASAGSDFVSTTAAAIFVIAEIWVL